MRRVALISAADVPARGHTHLQLARRLERGLLVNQLLEVSDADLLASS